MHREFFERHYFSDAQSDVTLARPLEVHAVRPEDSLVRQYSVTQLCLVERKMSFVLKVALLAISAGRSRYGNILFARNVEIWIYLVGGWGMGGNEYHDRDCCLRRTMVIASR